MIYIIIPVHNRKEITRNCLLSLNQQNWRDYKVIVVDDGSTDGTNEMIQDEFPDVDLLRGDGNLWWAGAINKGIRYALDVCQLNDYILSLNDDLIVPKNYLNVLINTANRFLDAIVGSVETTMHEPNIIKSGGIIVNWPTVKVNILNRGRNINDFPREYIIHVSELTGRGTLFPSRVFREVGLFDEINIKQCADVELPLRANLRFGYPLLICYDALVISHVDNKENINNQKSYSLSDAKNYFFDIRSHYNLINRYWISKSVAPNVFWFIRYLFFESIRTIGHFLFRLRLRM